MTCASCPRWAPHGRGRYGRCALPRHGAKPYWFGKITRHDQLDTADIHGVGCAANLARLADTSERQPSPREDK